MRFLPRAAVGFTCSYTSARSLGGGLTRWSTKDTPNAAAEFRQSLASGTKVQVFEPLCGVCLLADACRCNVVVAQHPPLAPTDAPALGEVSDEDA